jgi:cyanophycinase
MLGGLALMIPAAATAQAARHSPGYAYYEIGDTARPTPGPTAGALMLVGGGDWDYGAFRWFAERAGHGHIVVLRASGEGEAGEEIYRQVGGVLSVQTLVFSDRRAANDPKVLATLAHADGIFIAGGDQSNYVRYWKGTPVARAINAHIRKGKPVGGTSAGLAILGGTGYGAMDGGSIDSPTALAAPFGPAMTLVSGFLHMPRLEHVVTDTHFSVRDRLGRLIAFVTNARRSDPKAIGLGIDEGSALCVEADGTARLHNGNGGFAWLVEPVDKAAITRAGVFGSARVRITGISTASVLDLNRLAVRDPAFSGIAEVRDGKLLDVPGPKRPAP